VIHPSVYDRSMSVRASTAVAVAIGALLVIVLFPQLVRLRIS
jgi:hypothetical protein